MDSYVSGINMRLESSHRLADLAKTHENLGSV